MRSLALASIATVTLSACGGGHGATSAIPATASNQGSGNQAVPSSLAPSWNEAIVKQAQYVGPLTADEPMTVHVGLTLRNESALRQYAQDASNPQSPLYRHFLTPQEIGTRFGASATDIANINAYFKANGLTFSTWPQHLTGVVHGKRSAMERAFGVTFGAYKIHGTSFVAPSSGTPHFSQVIPVKSALLAANYTPAQTYIVRLADGNFIGYSPQQIGRGFDYSGAWSSGYTGSGITVGIIGTGPIDVGTNTVFNPQPNDGGDVGHYQKTFGELAQFGLPATGSNLRIVPALPQPASAQNNNTGSAAEDPNPSGLATPPPVTGSSCIYYGVESNYPMPSCNPEDGEAQLDTESVAGLAPNATINFYLAFNNADCAMPNACPPGAIGIQGLVLADDEIQQAIADNTADVLSLSYGMGEVDGLDSQYFDANGAGVGPDEFAALAAEGVAVFVSSGDTGNESCVDPVTDVHLTTPCVAYPAADPSVVGVGGVNIPLDASGALIGQIGSWGSTTMLGGDGSFGNNIGSGGGVSQYFNVPAFQLGVQTPSSSNPPSPQLNGKRGVPDIALDADPFTGPAMLMNAHFGGGFGATGGTSAAAPEAAAMWALVLQACKQSAGCATATSGHSYRLGNPDGLLYQIYSGKNAHMAYSSVFDDVLYGQNQANGPQGAGGAPGSPITGCCTAGPGYDLVTGLGAPFAGHLIQALSGMQTP